MLYSRKKTDDGEISKSQRGLGHVQGCGTHGDGVERTDHQAQDQMDRGAAVVLQSLTDAVRRQDHTQADPNGQGQHPGQIGEMQMQQLLRGIDRGYIDTEDQQQRGAGDTGQQHGGDGKYAADHQIGQLEQRQAPEIQTAKAAAAAAKEGHGGHQPHAQKAGQDGFEAETQAFPLFPGDEGNGPCRQAKKQRAEKVDALFKDLAQDQHGAAHAQDPAETEFEKVKGRVLPPGVVPAEEIVQSAQKTFVKAQNEGNGAPGHTGNAVRQGHGHTVQHGFQHRNRSPLSAQGGNGWSKNGDAVFSRGILSPEVKRSFL